MARLKPLPAVWLVSDARNDAVLEAALARLPRGSGFIFRHFHLSPVPRRARFTALARIARARDHVIIVGGTMAHARAWQADGAYGSPRQLSLGPPGLRLAAVHSLRELAQARRADLVLLSPAFATRSHPGGLPLGSLRFRLLAARAQNQVIALGGMNARTAQRLGWPRWAAIDAFLPIRRPALDPV
jgi:thiamine-phosphate pyrophosphorylase